MIYWNLTEVINILRSGGNRIGSASQNTLPGPILSECTPTSLNSHNPTTFSGFPQHIGLGGSLLPQSSIESSSRRNSQSSSLPPFSLSFSSAATTGALLKEKLALKSSSFVPDSVGYLSVTHPFYKGSGRNAVFTRELFEVL